jgi:hypothetical protein
VTNLTKKTCSKLHAICWAYNSSQKKLLVSIDQNFKKNHNIPAQQITLITYYFEIHDLPAAENAHRLVGKNMDKSAWQCTASRKHLRFSGVF